MYHLLPAFGALIYLQLEVVRGWLELARFGGFNQRQRTDQHDYLRIRGGFLHCRAEPDGASARLVLRHVDTSGEVQHQDVVTPKASR